MTMRGSIHLDEFGRSLHQSLPPPQRLGPSVNPQVEEFTPADKPISKTGPFPSSTCRMVIMMRMK